MTSDPSSTTRAWCRATASGVRHVDLALVPVAALGLEEDDRVVRGDRLPDHAGAPSAGLLGVTTRSPAVWAKYASGDSEWCSTAPMPPP